MICEDRIEGSLGLKGRTDIGSFKTSRYFSGGNIFVRCLPILILHVLTFPAPTSAAWGTVVSTTVGRVAWRFRCENWIDYTGPFQVHGGIVAADPENACSRVAPPSGASENGPAQWILLSNGTGCNFATKVMNAQDSGYSAVIIYHPENPSVEDLQVPMNETWESDYVFACYVHQFMGNLLRKNFTYTEGYLVDLKSDDNEINWWFIIVLAMIFGVCLMLFVLCFRFAWYVTLVMWQRLTTLREDFRRIARERRRAKRNKLFAAALKQVPSHRWDPTQLSESCAICVEEFVPDEDLRILNCNHGFHLSCIDEWLINGRRDCPVCKRKVLLENHDVFSNTDSETDDETAPLLSHSINGAQSPPYSNNTTPSHRRENPFLRGNVLNIQQSATDGDVDGSSHSSQSSESESTGTSYSQIP